MRDYCAFSHNHRCIKWIDYEVTRHELAEADETCHGNWIEITHLREYVDRLQETLRQNGIKIPGEYPCGDD